MKTNTEHALMKWYKWNTHEHSSQDKF